jgi:hypothetical protein
MLEILAFIALWAIVLLIQGTILALGVSWVYKTNFNIKRGLSLALVLFGIYLIMAIILGGIFGIPFLFSLSSG